MRIGISGFFLDKPMTGSGQYTINLLRELGAMTEHQLFVFCSSELACDQARQLTSGNVVRLTVPFSDNLGKVWYEQVALLRACRKHNIELLHVPYFGSPLFAPCRTVVTIHDLIMLILPEHRGSMPVRLYTALAGAAAKRADLIIVDSQCTKRDVVRLLGVPEQKARVVHLACEERFQPPRDDSRLANIRRKYGLENEFVLYLGGLDWRKNVTTLIRAFARISGPWQLAIAGEPYSSDKRLYPDLRQVVHEMGAEDRVKFLGFVAEEDMPALYSAASLFVFPSLYEGFGLPPLEAMACGTPVLCSNAASLPEVVGDGAMLFDPKDEDALSQALASLLGDEVLRSELREAGLRQVQRFSWHNTAERTLEAYKLAAFSPTNEPANAPVDNQCRVRDQNIALKRALREARGHTGRALEVGCGGGRFVRAIVRHCPDLEGHGCDISSEAIALASSAGDGVAYMMGDLLQLPYADAQFDMVFAFDVLEHLHHPDRGITEACRVLKQGGELHALVPCEGQPLTLHWLMWKLNMAADVKCKHGSHVQRFSHRGLLSLLADKGFQVTNISYSMHPLGQIRDILTYLAREDWAARWLLRVPFVALRALLWPLSYIESNLLSGVPLSAVAIHVTAKKR